jgi:hypothetical protein
VDCTQYCRDNLGGIHIHGREGKNKIIYSFIECGSGQISRALFYENFTDIWSFFFLICIVGGGVQTGSTRHVGHLLAYCTCPG